MVEWAPNFVVIFLDVTGLSFEERKVEVTDYFFRYREGVVEALVVHL